MGSPRQLWLRLTLCHCQSSPPGVLVLISFDWSSSCTIATAAPAWVASAWFVARGPAPPRRRGQRARLSQPIRMAPPPGARNLRFASAGSTGRGPPEQVGEDSWGLAPRPSARSEKAPHVRWWASAAQCRGRREGTGFAKALCGQAGRPDQRLDRQWLGNPTVKKI